MPQPGSAEWKARLQSLLAEEFREPLSWWYLSFAEPGRFLGAVIVQAHGPTSAIQNAHSLGINPGGQVMSLGIGIADGRVEALVPEEMRNRLLTRDEVEALDSYAAKSSDPAN